MLRIKAEKIYYEKEFNKHAHDSKRTWKVIKTDKWPARVIYVRCSEDRWEDRYSRSPGPDGIDPLIAKKTIESVAGVVSAIINSSFKTGIIPPRFKNCQYHPYL